MRLVVGVEWLRARWEQIGDLRWTAGTDERPAGSSVEGFLRGAIARAQQ